MKTTYFYLLLSLILLLAAFLRMYHFPERFGLGSDDARDIMIAQESLIRQRLPQFGSFSSAGPFVFGPLFYWIIIASKFLFPHSLETPYVVTLLLSIGTVGVFLGIGYLTGGRRMAIIIGLLAASSPQLVLRSVVLGQHSYVALFGTLALLFFVLFYKKRRIIYFLAAGVATGTAVSMHYQGLNLLLFAPAVFFLPVSLRQKIYAFFSFFAGLILTQLPLLYWDSHQQFANTGNLLDYILIAQYRIYTPNSWKLFIGNYLPTYWSYVSGGYKSLGILSEIFVGFGCIYLWIRKRFTHPSLVIFSIFFLLLGINRYYRGERFEGYMIYLVPFILFASSYVLSKLSKIFTIILLAILVMGNIFFLVKILPHQTNHLRQYQDALQKITSYFPNQKIALYDYSWLNSDISYPISLLLSQTTLGNRSGVPVGIHCKNCLSDLPVITMVNEHPVVVLDKDLIRDRGSPWLNVNQENLYNGLISQWEQKNLRTTFSLTLFLRWKLGLK
ncbi:glycosyltransferase family 39 protein [Candidatus Gottesmanbacteria bacterium]|nr:glycosyltransferase family 39 protein [Candidatus Gottesmanbacteria bacterium]